MVIFTHLAFLGLAVLQLNNVEAFSKHGRPLESIHCDVKAECGEEVSITDYIGQGDITGARDAIRVENVFPEGVDSYAGFASVNETAKNKLFFWYVPPLNGDADAPLLIWLQGGPGGSSLFGMFSEMGPYFVSEDGQLVPNEASWNKEYGMIFIDNPVGAGYSYTETETGYCTNTKVEVSSQLFELMQQFYTVFPELLNNELVITGESYAGHYVPGLAYKIHQENAKGEAKYHLPLTGLAIGDGWVDPYSQMSAYPDMLFNTGTASEDEKLIFQDYVTRTQKLIEDNSMTEAFTVWDEMMNGDIFPYPSYWHNVTGSNDYDNFMDSNEPDSLSYYYPFVTSPETRSGIHVGDAIYNDGSKCEMNLVADFMVSFKDEVSVLMENYKVLIYSGQLDVIIGAALTEKMIPTIPWAGRAQFLAQQKKVWRVDASDSEVAGYVKQFSNLTQAVVRGAGHLVPFDQPVRSLDLINKWIKNVPFVSYIDPVV